MILCVNPPQNKEFHKARVFHLDIGIHNIRNQAVAPFPRFAHQHACQIDISPNIVVEIDINIGWRQTRQCRNFSVLPRKPRIRSNLKMPVVIAL
jgi:hypothetical protein